MYRIAVLAALTAQLALSALAQKKEQFVEMQRDIALLQDQLRTLEKSQGDRLQAIEKSLAVAIDNQGKIAATLSAMERNLTAQQKALVAPAAAIGSKVDDLSTEVGAFRGQLEEINSSLRRVQGQMVDMSNAIKILQAPPPAPAPQVPDPNQPPPGMTSETLYQGAMRAKSAGQYDLAMQQFTDYLRYYGQTDLAANAQFYIGEIYYSQQNFEEALRAFDAVLERFAGGNKTPDAQYMKGMTLLKMDRKADARTEFSALVKQAPGSEQAAKARDQLKRLTPAGKKR
jgi:tol-pal system protein YbgF